jgi:uncharacterized membrane protein
MDQFIFAATMLAALGAALLAGNFFAFSVFLMRALGGLSAERGIVAMQAITIAIKGLAFLIVFFGTAALAALLAVVAVLQHGAPGSCYLLAGSVVFLIGTFCVTMLRNVALNRALTCVTPGSKEGHETWKRFQSSWGMWNHVRSVTSLVACAFFIMALVDGGNPFGTQ